MICLLALSQSRLATVATVASSSFDSAWLEAFVFGLFSSINEQDFYIPAVAVCLFVRPLSNKSQVSTFLEELGPTIYLPSVF